MKVNQATHPVGMMCRLLQISRSGFYAWRDRPMCTRKRKDLALTGKIAAIHRFSRETYDCVRSENTYDGKFMRRSRSWKRGSARKSSKQGSTLSKIIHPSCCWYAISSQPTASSR